MHSECSEAFRQTSLQHPSSTFFFKSFFLLVHKASVLCGQTKGRTAYEKGFHQISESLWKRKTQNLALKQEHLECHKIPLFKITFNLLALWGISANINTRLWLWHLKKMTKGCVQDHHMFQKLTCDKIVFIYLLSPSYIDFIFRGVHCIGYPKYHESLLWGFEKHSRVWTLRGVSKCFACTFCKNQSSLSQTKKSTRLKVILEIKHQTILFPFTKNGNIVQPVRRP